MAHAKSTIVTTVETAVVLNLDPIEAGILRQVLRRIGGSPDRSARGVTERIGKALDEANAPTGSQPIMDGTAFGDASASLRMDSVYFRDTGSMAAYLAATRD